VKADVDMVNPLNWRTILLERHAQHVVFIHFPVALFITGVVFDLLSGGKRDSHLGSAAYLNFSVATAFLPPTVVSGVLAWQFALGGARLEGILLLHAVAALSATGLIVAAWWHWQARKGRAVFLPRNRVPVERLGVAVIALTAHLGGFVSGINH
jgi:uncharacterized membrane protein